MTKRSFRTPALLAAALLLNACGLIRTPTAPLPDVTLNVPPLSAPADSTVYLTGNAFQGFTLPGLLSHVSVTGQAAYTGVSGTRTFNVLLATQKPDCPEVQGALACGGKGGGEVIGTVTLAPGMNAALSLTGTALDQAAHAGSGYLGVQFQNGPRSGPADTLKLSGLQAGAAL